MDELEAIGRVVVAMVNKFTERILMPYDTDEIKFLIDNDVTLVDIYRKLYQEVQTGEYKHWKEENKERWDLINRMLLMAASIIIKVPRNLVEEHFSLQNVLNLLREKRPDVYELVRDGKGKVWLERSIEQLKEALYDAAENLQKQAQNYLRQNQ